MFSKSSPEKESSTGMATIVAAGTEIKGNIECKGDIRVDGTLTGNLQTASKVIIGTSGKITGDVIAQQADVLGHVAGTMKVSELLYLKGNCHVTGNIYAGQLQVDATATFNGECHMGATAVSNAPMASVVGLRKDAVNAAANDQ
ncbi:MAG: polymer-forming cytoskeletal protein [Lacibacter sp.]